MENLENQVDSQITQESQDQPAPEAQAQPTENLDWNKDKRKGVLWKSENDLYKSYREMEKMQSPLKSELNTIKESFKKYGVEDPKKITEILEEYRKLKDPEYEVNKFLGHLDPILSNEVYSNQLKSTIEKLRKEAEREKFGSNLSDTEIQALKEAQSTKSEMEELRIQLAKAEIKEKMQASLKDIDAYAKENDLEFDQGKFLNACAKEGIPANMMLRYFKSEAIDAVRKHAAQQSEERVIKNLEKTKTGSISGGTKVATATAQKQTLDKALDSVLGMS